MLSKYTKFRNLGKFTNFNFLIFNQIVMHFFLRNDTSQWVVDEQKHFLILFLKAAQIPKFCILHSIGAHHQISVHLAKQF
jgi:hypothetical protein